MKKLSEDITNNNIIIKNIKKYSYDYKPDNIIHTYKNIPTFKIIFLGKSNSGKTTIIEKYLNNNYIYNHNTTICIDFKTKFIYLNNLINNNYININDKLLLLDYYEHFEYIKLHIWDTSGNNKYKNILKSYLKNLNIIVLVFDVNDNEYYETIHEYLQDIEELNDNPELFIVLNKIDIKKQKIDINNIVKYYKIKKYNYIKISCIDNINIDELFIQISLILIKNDIYNNNYINNNISHININNIDNFDDINSRSYCY
jgi:small GTP-binding protein